jgi:hypothetical protein
MSAFHRIRRWRQAGLCGLRCLAICVAIAFAIQGLASTQTSAADTAAKPATATPKKKKSTTASHSAASSSSTSQKATTHKSGSARSTTGHGKKGSKSSNSKASKTSRKRGQQAIDSTRARAIQEALIREHYMQGEPSGSWDAATQAAMQKFQADQGWQSKTTPDSRALIKLGLGPSNDHLLNPESAMTMPASDSKAAAKPPAPANKVPDQ